MPRTSTTKPAGLSQHTLAQLDTLLQKAEQKLAETRADKTAIEKEQKRRADAAQHAEEVRLGTLAYAAGLAGVEAGILEKLFAEDAAGLSPVEMEEE